MFHIWWYFQIILQLEGIVLKVIGIILQQNIMGMCVRIIFRLLFDLHEKCDSL